MPTTKVTTYRPANPDHPTGMQVSDLRTVLEDIDLIHGAGVNITLTATIGFRGQIKSIRAESK